MTNGSVFDNGERKGEGIMIRLLVILSAVFALTSVAAPLDSASGTSYGGYGAIAYSPSTGAFGRSWNWESQWRAEEVAVGFCGQWDCRPVVWVHNACAALAVSHFNTFQFGWGYSTLYAYAVNNAMAHCPGDCYVKTSVCTN